MAVKKRSRMDNPAESYFSSVTEPTGQQEEVQTATTQSKGTNTTGHITNYKEMLKQVEARSKRLQCLIQPSLYSKIKILADQDGISLNDLVHTTLETLAKNKGQ
jgi:predicted HicB family RNase H-like nuclease